jgi:hypothetical protein
MDMLPSRRQALAHSKCGVTVDGACMSHRFDKPETPPDFIGLPHLRHWHG